MNGKEVKPQTAGGAFHRDVPICYPRSVNCLEGPNACPFIGCYLVPIANYAV